MTSHLNNVRVSTVQVNNICALLQNTTLSAAKIAVETNSTRSIVRNIYRGLNWTSISEDYDFTERQRNNAWRKQYTKEQ